MALLEHFRNHSRVLDDVTMNDVWDKGKALTLRAWGRSTRRMRISGAFIIFLSLSLYLSYPQLQNVELSLPSVSLDYHYEQQASKFNESKVALLIENRPFPLLAPLMLHFISVVPPDWRFRFMGSVESVEHINKSMAIREQVAAGKLDLTYIPANMSTGSQEEISRFLTNLWLYEVVLQPAEWLLVFQTDSILCANSHQSLNDYLEFDWVGAPWNPRGRFGGNGGLSLRRVSAIIDVLRNQQRVDGSEPEDVWLTDRLGHRPGSTLANGTVSTSFSGEAHSGKPIRPDADSKNISAIAHKGLYNTTLDTVDPDDYVEGIDEWRNGFYEPMGYHTGGSGRTLHGGIWGTPERRKHIWEYCPEVKMTLRMDVAQYVPGNCGSNWKRWDMGDEGAETGAEAASSEDLGHGTEIIDGEEYPLLPENLTPW
ncbi:hypothetical protein QBC33DRAFT_543959 [Phialemonium atrogriseum]|uniref:DUF5672 domain-containing protein n=1 Tax=Phialemonium atrogriseum TaxID=1093897 RepID=A0AAJ0BWJ7_9PEZI|nr:uncharacterized protein QBC33DRAFT_543959 [Phialemonium atrogriseum]KAK1765785.1 hypothetical protein QBC33DRAFT_543959 [Phialemonium atrogriseum]